MSRLTWYNSGNKFYHSGLDRGVIYPALGEPGTVWSGLVSVSIEHEDNDVATKYIDGKEFNYSQRLGQTSASIESYTIPPLLVDAIGRRQIANGVYCLNHSIRRFNVAYRTSIESSQSNSSLNYRLHLLYNCTTSDQDRSHETLKENMEAKSITWPISMSPLYLAGHKPSSYFVFDTREYPLSVISQIEDILYGNENTSPRMLTIPNLQHFLNQKVMV